MTEQNEQLRSTRIGEVPPGEPFCNNCGYFLRGLDDSSRCPECGKPIVEVLMRKEFAGRMGKRYRSSATLFGLPLIDVALGPSGAERIGKAKGIIAIGDLAIGGLAIGAMAGGIVAFGGMAVGVFSLAGLALGLLTACEGLAICTGIASGGLSVGAISFGGLAVGAVAQGGLAGRIFARGSQAFGKHFPPTFHRFHWLLGNFPPTVLDTNRPLIATILPAIIATTLIGILVAIGMRRSARGDER